MLDLFDIIKNQEKKKTETDFYAIVSAIAQFIEKVDNNENREDVINGSKS